MHGEIRPCGRRMDAQLGLRGPHRPNWQARVLQGAISCKAVHDPITTEVASMARLLAEAQ